MAANIQGSPRDSKPLADLTKAALGGPVVILNASLGCHAVVIRSPNSPAEHVALPGMTYKKLGHLKPQLWRSTRSSMPRHEGRPHRAGLNPDFMKILGELWASVAWPVIRCLGLKVLHKLNHVKVWLIETVSEIWQP
jgi:hypothetical protein